MNPHREDRGQAGRVASERQKRRARQEWTPPADTAVVPNRFATVMKIDEPFDTSGKREQVISIQVMADGATPPVYDLDESNPNAKHYAIERVPHGVQIGMVRGGKVDAVGGFGWRSTSDRPR
jgi:hypothetical protein